MIVNQSTWAKIRHQRDCCNRHFYRLWFTLSLLCFLVHILTLDELFILILNFLREICEPFLILPGFCLCPPVVPWSLTLGSCSRSPLQRSAGPTHQRELRFVFSSLSLSLSLTPSLSRQLSLFFILFFSVSGFTFFTCAHTSSYSILSEKKRGSEMVLQHQMKDIFATFSLQIWGAIILLQQYI